jgi:GNAT superfamily N-acetyltransferase
MDPTPAAHRCANEYDVLVENAQRALETSRLRDQLPNLPRRWSMVGIDTTLRPAVRPDIPALQRVRLAVRENRLSDPTRITEADYVAAMEELGRTWVIEEGGEVVAFASGYLTGGVWALFVHPDCEGRGHGKALHAALVAWLWSLGHSRLSLTTEPGSRAERFYVAQGWRPAGTTPDGELRLELSRPGEVHPCGD